MPCRRHRLSILFLLATLLALAVAPRARAQDARTVAAQQDMAALAAAEETCAAFSGFYVSLEDLNDVTYQSQNTPWDWINNGGGAWLLRPSIGRFDSTRHTMTTGFGDPYYWDGPFLNFNRGTQTGPTPYDQGSPLDPWGQPYLFFSPLGLVRGDSGSVSLDSYGDSFDRYTLVSYGPDGVQSGDDLIWPFGAGVSAYTLTGLSYEVPAGLAGARPAATPATPEIPVGAIVTLRGANLGVSPSGAQVRFGETDLTDSITSWTQTAGYTAKTRIALRLPPALTGAGGFSVRRGGTQTNTLAATITAPPPSAARSWRSYR